MVVQNREGWFGTTKKTLETVNISFSSERIRSGDKTTVWLPGRLLLGNCLKLPAYPCVGRHLIAHEYLANAQFLLSWAVDSQGCLLLRVKLCRSRRRTYLDYSKRCHSYTRYTLLLPQEDYSHGTDDAPVLAGNERTLEEVRLSLSASHCVPLTVSPNIVWLSLVPNFHVPNDGNWDTAWLYGLLTTVLFPVSVPQRGGASSQSLYHSEVGPLQLWVVLIRMS